MSNASSDRLYKALINQFSGAVFLFNEKMALLAWNDNVDEICPNNPSLKREEYLPNLLQLPSDESLEALKTRLDNGQISTAFCALHACPDASYGLTTFRPLMQESRLTGFLVQIHPKLSMNKLPEFYEHLFTDLLDHIKEAVVITDAQIDVNGPQVVYVNQAFLDQTGYHEAEIDGEGLGNLNGIAELKESFAKLKDVRLRQDGEPVNDYQPVNFDILDWKIFPFQENDGSVLYYMAIHPASTDPQSTSRRLTESERIFRTVSQHSQVGLFLFQDDSLVYANPKTCEITGYTEKALTQADPFSLIAPEHREEMREKVSHQLNQRLTHRQYQYQIITKKGDKRDVEVLASLIEYHNKPALLGSALDVTERNEAFEKLKNNQQFSQKIAEASPIIIAITDYSKMQYTYENGKFQRIIGYTMEEVNAMEEGLLSLVHSDDLPVLTERYHENLQLSDGEVNNTTFRVKTKSGEYRWISATDTPFEFDERGELVKILTTALDITKQQQNIANLQEQDNFIKDVTQNMPGFINIYDYEQASFIYENHSILAYLGYEPDQAESRLPFFHPEDRDAIKEYNKHNVQLKKGEINTIEYRMQHQDGHYRWFYNRDVVHKRSKDGSVKQVLGLITDITAQKNTQYSLKQNEAYYRQLVENAPVGIVTLDLNYCLITCNQAFEQLFGYQEQELQHVPIDDIIVPDDLKHEAVEVTKNSLEGQTEWRETVRLTKAGKKVPVIVYGVPVFFEGEPVSIYGIYVDITERKQAEDALARQTEALLYSNAELEQFAYITSHHLRSPVVNLNSLAALFDKTELRDPENQYIFQKLQESAEELNRTLGDITHILEKKDNLSEPKETVHFEEVFEEAMRLLQEVIQDKQAAVTTNFSKAPQIPFIRSFLSSICYHLLSNALGFHHPDRKPVVHFETERQGNYICLKACDNGLGINLDRSQERIFELYKGVHEGRSGKGRGLYLVKYQVEAMGGYIHVESQVDVGSWFYIYLPVFSPNAA